MSVCDAFLSCTPLLDIHRQHTPTRPCIHAYPAYLGAQEPVLEALEAVGQHLRDEPVQLLLCHMCEREWERTGLAPCFCCCCRLMSVFERERESKRRWSCLETRTVPPTIPTNHPTSHPLHTVLKPGLYTRRSKVPWKSASSAKSWSTACISHVVAPCVFGDGGGVVLDGCEDVNPMC